MTEVDVVVIGLGPGGEHTAIKLAEAGLEVVGIDSGLVGGECPYYGCIPSKMMIRAANLLAEGRRIAGVAGDSSIEPSWAPVAARIREEATDNWDDTAAVERLQKAGARFVRGHGRLEGERTVVVGDQRFTARRGVVLNTGTEPAVPPIAGLAGSPYWTNREAVAVESLPASLAVIGGGAIGLELAQAFSRFGVQVTVLEGASRILAPEEPEVSALMTEVLRGEGVRVMAGASIDRVSYADGRFTVGEVTADKLLVAAGRRTNLADVGLDSVGLDPDVKSLETDERMRVQEGLWAVGDITGKGGFTHVSMYQAGIAVRDLLGKDGPPADYRAVPRVTFTDPEVGSVGMTEKQARDAGLDVRVGTADVPPSARGWLHKTGNQGLVKVVSDGEVLVGATSVGPMGGEVLSMLATAIHARVPVNTLRSMIFAYPTFHRAVENALKELEASRR
ncbi:MAG TPA: NAD(P)/FAD-dependent oxidoreductase [Nocardioidaceae bacterium]|nr:NAD(P)/FAD-dependent oxidoreductase [Nocardioidaceae bacterium]